VHSVSDLLDDEQLVAVGLFQTDEHPLVGRVRTARLPVSFSRTPSRNVSRAPLLGEHSEEVLGRRRGCGG
jgi:crotonobetainyl-CoA:carnitine CoA-transferase CaiB-like acyl-CoA transferase